MNKSPDGSEPFSGATSKFHAGQRCLTLRVEGKLKAGTEVVLAYPAASPVISGTWAPVSEQCWITNKSYIYTNGGLTCIRESRLLPLDDPKIAKQVNDERFDNIDERMAKFSACLAEFDKALKQLEDQLKVKRAI